MSEKIPEAVVNVIQGIVDIPITTVIPGEVSSDVRESILEARTFFTAIVQEPNPPKVFHEKIAEFKDLVIALLPKYRLLCGHTFRFLYQKLEESKLVPVDTLEAERAGRFSEMNVLANDWLCAQCCVATQGDNGCQDACLVTRKENGELHVTFPPQSSGDTSTTFIFSEKLDEVTQVGGMDSAKDGSV